MIPPFWRYIPSMLLALSIILVLGPLGVFVGTTVLSNQGELGFGFEQMIHARIPWLLLGSLGIGAGLGIWSLVKARRWYKWVVVPIELVLAGLMTFYFTSASFLPPRELAISIGDPFPPYSLLDQDGRMLRADAPTDRRPALYIFYRGDW